MQTPDDVAAFEKRQADLHARQVKDTIDAAVDRAIKSQKLTAGGGEFQCSLHPGDLSLAINYVSQGNWCVSYEQKEFGYLFKLTPAKPQK